MSLKSINLLPVAICGALLLNGCKIDFSTGDIVCTNLKVATPAGSASMARVFIKPEQMLRQCQSKSGQKLYLVTPTDGFTGDIETGMTVTQFFVVGNTEGQQARAKILISRP